VSDEAKLSPEDPSDVAPAAALEPAAQTEPLAPAAPEPQAFTPAPEPVAVAPAASAAQRPEVAVGAAFAGGFLAALILKRLAR
jgi:hypothetical protein